MRFLYRLLPYWLRLLGLAGRLPPWLRIPLFVFVALIAVALGLILWIPLTILNILWGLVRGIWYRFFPPPATRDVSRLGDDADAIDTVAEIVQDEGKPAKPQQRRQIYRDPRLLPKPQLPQNVWPRPRPKKVMTRQEAVRLFSDTLRTTNRQIRDLLADEEQLQRYGLPIWKSEQDLADVLGISVGMLRHYSIHRDRDAVSHYVTFSIPKRSGQRRIIMAPKRRLKALQRKLLRLLVEKLPVSAHAHGFCAGRSVRSGAGPHVGRVIVLKMDLKDFFPSVTFARVRGLLIALGYGYPVATTLAVLMTESERQPVDLAGKLVHVPVRPRYCVQGAPTSPSMCNAICQRLDRRLAGLARKYGWNFTRYADDLTFSGNTPDNVRTIRRLVTRICKEEGFLINADKTRVLRNSRRQTVTGVVVNQTAGLSRQERRRWRAAIHRMKLNASDKPATLSPAELEGKLAYLQMLNPSQAESLRRRWQQPA